MTRYYLLQEPRNLYRRDWEREFVNGWVEYRLRLPGMTCDVCGRAGGDGRPLPIECPISIREEVELLLERGNVPIKELKRYTKRWSRLLHEQGVAVELLAGSAFQNFSWQVPSCPVYDFYWPFCAEHAIHERVHELLTEQGFTGVTLHPVIIEKMGLLEPTADYPKMLITDGDRNFYRRERRYPVAHGDYDVMFQRLPHTTDRDTIQRTARRYYSLCYEFFLRPQVLGDDYQSKRCPECGSENFQETNAQKQFIGQLKGKKLIPRRCLPQLDIFQSGVHHGIVVKDSVLSALSRLEPSNVRVDELTVCD